MWLGRDKKGEFSGLVILWTLQKRRDKHQASSKKKMGKGFRFMAASSVYRKREMTSEETAVLIFLSVAFLTFVYLTDVY